MVGRRDMALCIQTRNSKLLGVPELVLRRVVSEQEPSWIRQHRRALQDRAACGRTLRSFTSAPHVHVGAACRQDGSAQRGGRAPADDAYFLDQGRQYDVRDVAERDVVRSWCLHSLLASSSIVSPAPDLTSLALVFSIAQLINIKPHAPMKDTNDVSSNAYASFLYVPRLT